MVVVRDYQALISGSSLTGTTQRGAFVSYSFPVAVPTYLTGVYPAEGLATFQTFSEEAKANARAAMDAWAQASGLTAFEVAPGDGDIKFMAFDFAKLNSNAAGFAYYPGSGSYSEVASDVFIGLPYTLDRRILLHEVGHALGLKHPHEGDTTLASDIDNLGTTVMSYNFSGGPGNVLGSLDLDAIRYIYGGADKDGTQVASWNWNAATLTLTQSGGNAADTIFGIGGNDVIYGDGGDDEIVGRSGDDQLYGGAGNDRITAGAGRDTIDGGEGNDRIEAGAGRNTIAGGAGDDQISIVFGTDGFAIDGGAGNDSLSIDAYGFTGSELSIAALLASGSSLTGVESVSYGLSTRAMTVRGSETRDSIFLSADDSQAFGNGGNDYLSGVNNNRLYGGDGDDTLVVRISGSVLPVLEGGNGTDNASVTFTAATSRALTTSQLGMVGIETLTLTGGAGDDEFTVDTALSSVSLDGGAGADVLRAETSGTSTLRGGDGNDRLYAGQGFSFLYGGAGADRFVWESAAYSTNSSADQIEDFTTGVDVIDLLAFAPTNVRIQASGSGNWIYATSGTTQFALYVRQAVTMGDIRYDPRIGTSGDDVLPNAAGNDRFDGGAGYDAALFSGFFRQSRVTLANGQYTVSGSQGVDALVAVEEFRFADGRYVVSPDSVGAQVIRAYDTILGRAPDANGLDFYVDRMEDAGMSLVGVANDLAGSGEFRTATGGLSNAQFVDYVYRHALGRAPDAGGAAFYTQKLDQGLSRGAFVVELSESAEHRGLTAGLVAKGYFNTDDNYQAIALLYDSFLGRRPDAGGLAFYGDRIKAGTTTLDQIAADFAGSTEFRNATQSRSNAELVDIVYRNTLDRGPDSGGAAFYTDRLDHGMTLTAFVSDLAYSQEHYNLLGGAIIDGIGIM